MGKTPHFFSHEQVCTLSRIPLALGEAVLFFGFKFT